jgi:hypothetical protein
MKYAIAGTTLVLALLGLAVPQWPKRSRPQTRMSGRPARPNSALASVPQLGALPTRWPGYKPSQTGSEFHWAGLCGWQPRLRAPWRNAWSSSFLFEAFHRIRDPSAAAIGSGARRCSRYARSEMPYVLFRAIRRQDPRLADFWSDFAHGEEPFPSQLREPLRWSGVSMFSDLDKAIAASWRWGLGPYVAEVHIPDDADVVVRQTGRDLFHHSVMGTPATLRSLMVQALPMPSRSILSS